MADGKLIASVNEDLRAQHDDAVGHRENPRLILMLKSLILLTNSPEQNAKDDEAAAAQPDPKAEEKKQLQAQMDALQKRLASL